jgi:hypothetical protein
LNVAAPLASTGTSFASTNIEEVRTCGSNTRREHAALITVVAVVELRGHLTGAGADPIMDVRFLGINHDKTAVI